MSTSKSRRKFLKSTAAAGALGGVSASSASPAGGKQRNGAGIYARLGVRPVINGVGTVTVLGGSIMPEEVVRAMDEASRHFVPLPELQRKAGEHIAGLLKIPGALVTTGAAGAITIATVACMTRGDRRKLRRLPDVADTKHEIVIQKTHRSGYEGQILLAGAKLVWVETMDELTAAINDRTAMMFFLNKADPDGQIKRAEWIRVGKERGVPTFNDAAADVPPVSRLTSVVEEGFDLVAFSGGKGLLGPQCSGLLLGRKDLVDAGFEAQSPYGGIGRGMKVGKEEIVGLIAAVERYLKVDHAAERRLLDTRAAEMMDGLSKIKGVETRKDVPEIANNVPHVVVEWDESSRKQASQDVVKQLLEGNPPISVSRMGEGKLRISMWMLRGTEHRTIARRLKEIFG
ncbi:MAG: aminotransferase class V-fold PLP-dependent enzyme [Bryobacteraceae bacterium]